MNIKQKKATLVAALESNPDMGIREMMSYQLSESMCYKLRRQVRAIKASKETIRKLPKGSVDAVINMLRTQAVSVEEIREKTGVSRQNIAIIARDNGIDLVSRSVENRKRKTRRSFGSANGHKPMALESLSGDGMSLRWLTYSWGMRTTTGETTGGVGHE